MLKLSQYYQQGRANLAIIYLLSAALLISLGSWFAFNQAPRSDVYVPVSLQDKFIYPIEQNAFQRLAKISAGLTAVYALPNSRLAWAVGEKGLIIHSSDGGISWQQQYPDASQNSVVIEASSAEEVETEAYPYVYQQIDEYTDEYSNVKQQALSQLNTQQQQQAAPEQINIQQQAIRKFPSKGGFKGELNLPAVKPIIKQKTDTKQKRPPQKVTKTPQKVKLANLTAVFFIDAKSGWAVGDNGLILHTVNAGENWEVQKNDFDYDLTAISFINADQGWIVGVKGGIWHTINAGKNWRKQISKTKKDLVAVAFVDSTHGWAVSYWGEVLSTIDGENWLVRGRIAELDSAYSIIFTDKNHGWVVGSNGFKGIILYTSDGGNKWQVQKEKAKNFFHSVVFLNNDQGWFVADNTLLFTHDGGAEWQEQSNKISAGTVTSIAFSDAQHGYAVGDSGGILVTQDGGKNWQQQALFSELISVSFINSKQGWAVGNNGLILATLDAGENWQVQNSGTNSVLSTVTFIDQYQGWVAGSDGTILFTGDGGNNWKKQTSNTDGIITYIAFTDQKNGWAITEFGSLLSTKDGGKSWDKLSELSGRYFTTTLIFINTNKAWVVGDGGNILTTEDGGVNWQEQFDSRFYLNHLWFSKDGQQGWAAGEQGTLVHTNDGGENWQKKSIESNDNFKSISFTADAKNGWIVTSKGNVFSSEDAGLSWQLQDSGTNYVLHGVVATDPNNAWIVGRAGTILSTKNAGKTWATPAYKKSPAAWYYLLCLIALLLAILSLKTRQKNTEIKKNITDLLASDRPLQAGDPDPLGFNEIAQGLSRFMRNPKTEPPLTIAITGEWGTGKSSLMNLLHQDLNDKGFSTVWFNAWHHQKSEQLLATLFANIRRQAIPGWLQFNGLRPVGILFRLRLLARRNRQHWFILLFLAVVVSSMTAYLYTDSGNLTRLVEWLKFYIESLSKQVSIISSLIAATAVLVPIFAFFKSLQGFALNPIKLMTVQQDSKRASVDPSARYQFAREFDEVTSALDLGRMIIFIDDIDRCSQENVLEVLEAINFLVTSGQCYIVLGMAQEWVQICVGLGFKELATESFSNNHAGSDIDPIEFRRKFALQYLEKLINIEVPVPVMDEFQARKLTLADKPIQLSGFDKFSSQFLRYIRNNMSLLAFIAAMLLGGYLGLVGEIPTLKAKVKPELEQLSIGPATDLELLTKQGTRLALKFNQQPEKITEISSSEQSASTVLADNKQATGKLEWVLEVEKGSLKKGVSVHKFAQANAELLLRQLPTSKVADSTEKQTSSKTDNKTEKGVQEQAAPSTQALFTPGQTSINTLPKQIAIAFGGLLLGIGLFLLFRRPGRIVEDSKPFEDALVIWQDWLLLRKQTPRTVKRFLNNLRYMAMRHRSDTNSRSLFQRWFNKATIAVEPPVFTEPALVALSVLHYLEPSWVETAEKFSQVNQEKFYNLVADLEIKQEDKSLIITKLSETVSKHKKTFKVDELASEAQRALFEKSVR